MSQLTTASKLVIDFLLEKEHWLTCQATQQAKQFLSAEQIIETMMVIHKVFRAAKNALPGSIDLLRWE
jgi:predicted nucleic-acid-binding protein